MEGLFVLCNLSRKSNHIALIRDFATELSCPYGGTTMYVNWVSITASAPVGHSAEEAESPHSPFLRE
jgi:hypothetical protein